LSQTLTTQNMVDELNTRLGLNGLTNGFLLARLNIAFRWIKQQTGFKWDLVSAPQIFNLGSVTSALPSQFDPGSEATMVFQGLVVPYFAVTEFNLLKTSTPSNLGSTTYPSNFLTAWTFYTTGVAGSYLAEIQPALATFGGPVNPTLIYHSFNAPQNATLGNVYFPSPDEFDDLIVTKAEADIRFLYDIGGANARENQCQESMKNLLDRYRSTKKDMAGLVDDVRQSQEFQIKNQMAT
jgi:hypothetical protein